MAEKRISELTAKGSSLAANDLVEVSEYVSPGVYRTRYCTGTQIGGISSNFATADLTFTANRTHDISTYTLTLDGTTRVVSPGATSGDTAFTVRNNTDTDHLFKQDGTGAWTTKTTQAALTYTLGYTDETLGSGFPVLLIDAPSGGTSAMIVRQNGNRVFQFGSFGASDSALLATKILYIRDLASNQNQFIKDTSGRYLLCNDATATDTPATDTRLKIASDGLDYALKTDAKLNFSGLPTSSVGLSAGDVWNDAGTLKIV